MRIKSHLSAACKRLPVLPRRAAGIYNSGSPSIAIWIRKLSAKVSLMDNGKLEHFKQLLLAELREHARHVRQDQANAIELADDGAKESADLALRDLMSELVLNLGERESQMIADVDQALLRMEEGSYGRCAKCNRPIDERRLEALPTARYDAACQEAIESESGEARPTL